jgi:hypothetical protein
MKGYIPLILIVAFIATGFALIIIYADSPPEIDNTKYTSGTIVNFKQAQKSAGLNAVVEFKVNGVIYNTYIPSLKYKSNVIGEKYKVVFDSEEPQKNIVLVYDPVLDSLEGVGECEGNITRIYRFSWNKGEYSTNYGMEFSYVVSGIEFKKAQSMPKGFKDNYPSIKEGGVCRVRYWTQNPERSIVLLNESSSVRL